MVPVARTVWSSNGAGERPHGCETGLDGREAAGNGHMVTFYMPPAWLLDYGTTRDCTRGASPVLAQGLNR